MYLGKIQKAIWLIAIALTIGTPRTGVAQGTDRLCRAVARLTLGQWAEYDVKGSGLPGLTSMRWANIGSEAEGGIRHHWYEVKTGGTQKLITQILTPTVPSDIDQLKRMIIQIDDQPPMHITREMIQLGRQQYATIIPNVENECSSARIIGEETIVVGNRRIQATRLQGTEGDIWISTDVPFGIVKLQRTGTEFSLIRFGTGAVSSITQ